MTRALRALRARPGFTAAAVLTLAAGFGVNAAIFTLTRTVLLRPLPYRDVDRLVLVGEASPSRGVSYAAAVPANYAAWRDRVTAFDETAAWRFVYFTLSREIDPSMRVQGVIAAPSFFPMLGVAPLAGRQFTAEDARRGNDRVVMLSNGFWRRRFGEDPGAVGRTLTVDGTPCTIIGILPETFRFFHVLNRELEIWRPFVFDATDREHSINLYARLKRGVEVSAARAELAAAYAGLPAEAFRESWTGSVETLSARFTANQRPILQALECAAALVMCIAAANIANLLLAAAATRRRDLAVRVALGATRRRLSLEAAQETLILSCAGAAAGVLAAFWIVDLLNESVSYQDINRLEPFRVDLWVIVFVGGLAAAMSLVLALVPARRAADADVIDALKDASHGATAGASTRRVRSSLVIGELALAIVLLTSALELTRSALTLNDMDRGVETQRVMTAQLSLNAAEYAQPPRLARLAEDVLDRLNSTASVESASIVNYPPLSVVGVGVAVAIEGQPVAEGHEPVVQYWVVGPRYFATVGISLLAGRDFDRGDAAGRPGTVIVSRRLAERFWNRIDVVGKGLTPLLPDSDAAWIPRTVRRPLTVVGVVSDVREDGIPGHPDDHAPQLYLPYAQNPTRIATIVVRPRGLAQSAAALIRDSVRAADPDQPTFDEKTLNEVKLETFARSREVAWLIGSFAALALALSAIGVYGVIAFLTAARSREIGIRMALGASRGRVVAMIVSDAIRLAGAGSIAGAVLSPMAIAAERSWIAGIGQLHPRSIAAVVALLVAVCALAAAIPARHAASAGAVSLR
jgi:putative ABC transport system permease protein